MKKLTTRVLALVVALTMLLTSSAFAAERNAASFTIGNFEININGQDISLPVYLSLGGGVDLEGARGYLTADLSTQNSAAVSALGAFENGEIKAYLNGMSYGIAIPLEQAVALLEQEMGMTIEEAIAEAMSSIDEDTMTAVTGMTESAAALESIEIDPEALMAALGVTLSDQGTATVSLFTEQVSAAVTGIELKQQTCKDMFDALSSLDPALAEYMADYFATMNESLAASGEEMTIEEALAMITMSASGTLYEAEIGTMTDLTLAVTVEEETLELPLSFVTMTDDMGTYTLISSQMDVDGESIFFEFYVDDYTSDGVDQASVIVNARIGDTDAESSDVELYLYGCKEDSAENTIVRFDVSSTSYGETTAVGFKYTAYPVISDEAYDSYNGQIYVYAESGSEGFFGTADTNLTLKGMPEGELLTFAQSINPLEADEETMNQFMTDAQNALIQGVGVLMQDPTIASIIGGMMG